MSKTLTKSALWLEEKFVAWRQAQAGRRASIVMFAKFAGLTDDDFHNVMKGRGLPAEKVVKMAKSLNDDSAFDAFDIERPNPLRWALEKLFDALTPDEQQRLLDYAEELKSKKKGAQRGTKPKTTATE